MLLYTPCPRQVGHRASYVHFNCVYSCISAYACSYSHQSYPTADVTYICLNILCYVPGLLLLTTGGELLAIAPADLDGASHLFGGDSVFVDSIAQTIDSTSTSLAQVQASNVPSLYISKEEVHKPMIADEIMGHNYDPFSTIDVGAKKTNYSSLDALYGKLIIIIYT